MKLSKQKKFWLSANVLFALIACNNHTANSNQNHETTGVKKPVISTPTSKDTTINHSTKTGSPNEEYDQHKIDSIKQNKPKPKDRKGGKND
jgi:hypothetical protein